MLILCILFMGHTLNTKMELLPSVDTRAAATNFRLWASSHLHIQFPAKKAFLIGAEMAQHA